MTLYKHYILGICTVFHFFLLQMRITGNFIFAKTKPQQIMTQYIDQNEIIMRMNTFWRQIHSLFQYINFQSNYNSQLLSNNNIVYSIANIVLNSHNIKGKVMQELFKLYLSETLSSLHKYYYEQYIIFANKLVVDNFQFYINSFDVFQKNIAKITDQYISQNNMQQAFDLGVHLFVGDALKLREQYIDFEKKETMEHNYIKKMLHNMTEYIVNIDGYSYIAFMDKVNVEGQQINTSRSMDYIISINCRQNKNTSSDDLYDVLINYNMAMGEPLQLPSNIRCLCQIGGYLIVNQLSNPYQLVSLTARECVYLQISQCINLKILCIACMDQVDLENLDKINKLEHCLYDSIKHVKRYDDVKTGDFLIQQLTHQCHIKTLIIKNIEFSSAININVQLSYLLKFQIINPRKLKNVTINLKKIPNIEFLDINHLNNNVQLTVDEILAENKLQYLTCANKDEILKLLML